MGTVTTRPTVDDVSDAVLTESCCSLHDPVRFEALVTRCKHLREFADAHADAVCLVVRLDVTRCSGSHARRSTDTAIDVDARQTDRAVESPILRRSARFEEPQQRLLEEIVVNGRYYGCRLEVAGADRHDTTRALWPALCQALRT